MSDAESEPPDPSHTPYSPLGMCHVASWRNQISSSWSSNPHQEDGSALHYSRPILLYARGFLQQMFTAVEMESVLDPSSTYKTSSAALVKTHREVAPPELDAMPIELREKCLAIRGTDRIAIPLDSTDMEAPTMVHIGINRASKIEMHLLSDGSVLVGATSQKGQKQHTIRPDHQLVEACSQLFRVPDAVAPPDTIPIVARSYPSQGSRVPHHVEMPSWFSQRVGQVLQDGFRLHALLTAATAHGSRALVIEKVLLSIPSDLKSGCRLVVRLHKTCGTCICAAHQMPTSTDSYIEVSFAFCGKLYSYRNNKRCVRHAQCASNFADDIPICCLHNFSTTLTCRHSGIARPYHLSMDVPEDSVARLRILAAAAVALVDKTDCDALKTKEAVDTVFSVGEAFETPYSAKKIETDFIAVQVLRAGKELNLHSNRTNQTKRNTFYTFVV